jgi:hypothetical protein
LFREMQSLLARDGAQCGHLFRIWLFVTLHEYSLMEDRGSSKRAESMVNAVRACYALVCFLARFRTFTPPDREERRGGGWSSSGWIAQDKA